MSWSERRESRFEEIEQFIIQFKLLAVEIASAIGLVLLLFHALKGDAQ